MPPLSRKKQENDVRNSLEASTPSPSVIGNTIQVLRCFTAENSLLGVTEIANQVGLNKSTVSRMLATLEQDRIVEQDEETRKFRLGLGLIAIAGPLIATLDVRKISYPILKDLALQTGETVCLTIWDRESAVVVEQIPSIHHVKHTVELGTRYVSGLNSTVKVFLACGPQAEQRELAGASPFELPEHVSRDDYERQLKECEAQGYAVNYGAIHSDEVGVAVPVFNHLGDVAAAILLAAPMYRVPEKRLNELIAAGRESARLISQRMGASPIPTKG